MYLENIVFDAPDPGSLGRQWEQAVAGERLTDEPEGFETRMALAEGPVLDLCFQRVADPSADPPRLHLDLAAHDPDARTDPDTGPLAAVRLESADPTRDAVLWAEITGWVAVPGRAGALRHPSGRGPVLELVPETTPKGPAKNAIHLDVRLESGEDPDEVEARIVELGGAPLAHDWGELPWRSYLDPSGNEFCVLPARG
ncbi:MAG: VOC family protein [Marmoricola sp.]